VSCLFSAGDGHREKAGGNDEGHACERDDEGRNAVAEGLKSFCALGDFRASFLIRLSNYFADIYLSRGCVRFTGGIRMKLVGVVCLSLVLLVPQTLAISLSEKDSSASATDPLVPTAEIQVDAFAWVRGRASYVLYHHQIEGSPPMSGWSTEIHCTDGIGIVICYNQTARGFHVFHNATFWVPDGAGLGYAFQHHFNVFFSGILQFDVSRS
jgi:hypothetical protein